jgi:lipopolysaccharide export system permease protein
MTFLLANFVIPHANKKRITFQNTYLKNPSTYRERNTHLQISPNTFAYVESYNDETNTGYHFSLEKARKGTIYYKLSSDFIKWDSISKKWKIENYYIRLINGMEEKIKTGKQIDTVLNINPADFIQKIKNVGTMGFSQLRSFIKEEKLKGSSNIQFYEVEKHKRIAFPFSTIILTLIGVSLSSRKQRGGIGLSLGTGLTVSFAFILFMQVSTTFSTMGNLNPVIGVWMPNILFGVISIYLLKIVPK